MTQIDSSTLRGEEGTEWELKYYVGTLETNPITYSIKIERCSPGETLTEETGGITTSYEEAEKWAKIMAKGSVTPISLHDIVDDLHYCNQYS